MNRVKIYGQPRRDALRVLVPNWYKIFPPDHTDLAEMHQPTGLIDKTTTAQSCSGDQIVEYHN